MAVAIATNHCSDRDLDVLPRFHVMWKVKNKHLLLFLLSERHVYKVLCSFTPA